MPSRALTDALTAAYVSEAIVIGDVSPDDVPVVEGPAPQDLNEHVSIEDIDEPQNVHRESQTSSDSSLSPVLKRRRTVSKKCSSDNPVFTSTSQSESEKADDGGNICVICMESWTNVGSHQICCMPCGHVFGYHCIYQWLKGAVKPVCPTCKRRGGACDLRLLFGIPASLQTTDVSELEGLRKQLEQERSSHALTKDKAREKQKLISNLRQSLKDFKRRVESGSGVATFGDRRKGLEGLQSVCTHNTNGEILAAMFDTEARVLFAEKKSDNLFCVRRLDVRRALSPASPHYVTTKQITHVCVNTYSESDAFGYVAATDRGRALHVLDKGLKQAAVLPTATVPTTCTWLSSISFGIAVGFMTGEVCVYDVRFPSNRPLFQAKVDTDGWRYVHSLGELRGEHVSCAEQRSIPVLLAGAPKGLYATFIGTECVPFKVVSSSNRHESEQVCGVTVTDGLVAVGYKTQDGGSIAVHHGLRQGRRGLKLGESLGSRVRGIGFEEPFTRVGLLTGETDGRDVIVSSPDSFSSHGVSFWSSRRIDHGDLDWRRVDSGSTPDVTKMSQTQRDPTSSRRASRGVCMTALPKSAKLDSLPSGCRGLACYFDKGSLNVYTCGRYSVL